MGMVSDYFLGWDRGWGGGRGVFREGGGGRGGRRGCGMLLWLENRDFVGGVEGIVYSSRGL